MQPEQMLGEAVITQLIRECRCKHKNAAVEVKEEVEPPPALPAMPTLERIAANLPSRPPCRERIREIASEPLHQLAHEFQIIAGVVTGPDPEEAIEMFLASLGSALQLAAQMDRELAAVCCEGRLAEPDLPHCTPRLSIHQ